MIGEQSMEDVFLLLEQDSILEIIALEEKLEMLDICTASYRGIITFSPGLSDSIKERIFHA